MSSKTFKVGGVHPPENKITAGKAIEALPIPDTVFIPLSQHLGVPATPVVQKGDQVKAGQLIARGEAFISAHVHASVSGKVWKVDDITDTSGYRRKCIVIQTEGDDWAEEIDKGPDLLPDCSLEASAIIEKVKAAGVVGLGGAAFPSHVKLMVPKGKKAEVLILNGVECEPYLTADHRLMLEKGKEILVGLGIQMKALGVERAIIGIENNKPDAIAQLRDLSDSMKGIEVMPLEVKYPQGAEKQLIKAAINREVPSGKLPIEVGCVVHNVGTAFAVYEAVQKNKPLFERVVTLTGAALHRPGNYLVRLGTPVAALIEAAGGLPEDAAKLVNGGPMMGKALNDMSVPVTKGTSGILLLRAGETLRKPELNCIRCARCLNICPMGLEPYLLAALADHHRYEECESERIMDCMECGSCLYICPSGRPLLDQIRVGKAQLGRIMRERTA